MKYLCYYYEVYFKIYCILRGAFSYVDHTIQIHSSYLNNILFSMHTQRLLIILSTAYEQGYYHPILPVLFLSPPKLF